MRKIVIYIAMSLDGYIADLNGGVSWLSGDGSDNDNLGSYEAFESTVDTVILGYNTYHQIITELSPDNWVYKNKMSYVITHKKLYNKENIIFTQDLKSILTDLKSKEGKDIWICGGAKIINQVIDFNMVDRFCISVIPTILGNGINLFDTHLKELRLKLVSTQNYNGITDLVYEPKN